MMKRIKMGRGNKTKNNQIFSKELISFLRAKELVNHYNNAWGLYYRHYCLIREFGKFYDIKIEVISKARAKTLFLKERTKKELK